MPATFRCRRGMPGCAWRITRLLCGLALMPSEDDGIQVQEFTMSGALVGEVKVPALMRYERIAISDWCHQITR